MQSASAFQKKSFKTLDLTFAQKLHDNMAPLPGAPSFDPHVKNHILQANVPFNGGFANVVLVHPRNAKTAHALSEIQVEKGRRDDNQNVKPRIIDEFVNTSRIDERTKTTRGGLLVGLEYNNLLITMGSTALIADPGDGGRGDEFTRCPLWEQEYLKAGISHPDYASLGGMKIIFGWRIKTAVDMAEEYDRTHIVTKVVEDTPTADFYGRKEDKGGMQFMRDNHVHIIPEAPEGANRLLTFGRNIVDVSKWLAKSHPAIAQSGNVLANLPAEYKLTPHLVLV